MIYELSKLERIYFEINLMKRNVSQFHSFSAFLDNDPIKILLIGSTANRSNLAYKKQRLLLFFILSLILSLILPLMTADNSTRQLMSLPVLLPLI